LAVVLSVLVLVAAPFAVDPIRDAVTLGGVGEARLAPPTAYFALSPVSVALDTLTLLGVGQHIALLASAIVTYALVRARRARRRATTLGRETTLSLVFLLGIVVVYAVGALAPRPMAQLVVSDVTVLAVDFHSHTMYSHDGRAGWDPSDVRAWHRDAGFDVAYITDHRTFEGAERGIAANPREAGEETMLLQGIEAVDHGEHVIILSAGRRYRGLTTADLRDVDDQALALASFIPNAEPVVIETIPGKLANLVASPGSRTPGARAIELIDGAPRGLSQGRRERERIIRVADSLDLALVAGSDNHGWGRAAPGWTLMRVPGWRGMPSDSLALAIESIVRNGRRQSTLVVERRIAGGSTALTVALTSVLVPWRMLTTLSPDERIVWLVWIWAIVVIARVVRKYPPRPSRAA